MSQHIRLVKMHIIIVGPQPYEYIFWFIKLLLTLVFNDSLIFGGGCSSVGWNVGIGAPGSIPVPRKLIL
jgi:hypothetical protein